MNTTVYKKEINLPDGRVISIETGKLVIIVNEKVDDHLHQEVQTNQNL